MNMNLSTRTNQTAAIGSFDDFIKKLDYVGALAFIESGQTDFSPLDRLLWVGYCSSRLHDHSRARDAYLELLSDKFQDEDVPLDVTLFLAIVYLNLGQYTDAEEAALSISRESQLRSRILLHVAQKTRDETKLARYRQQLSDSIEDRLSAAAVEFSFRHRYSEVVDVYRGVLAGNVEFLSLYVYTAMALFKMGCHDRSLEALSIYSQSHPDSVVAANLKACNVFHLFDGKTAMEVLEGHSGKHSLVRHNAVVFNGGEGALRVLPGLVDKIPEARLNLAIYYLKHGEVEAASELLEGVDADSPQSHMVQGILNAELARARGGAEASEFLAKAKHHFQGVGQSSTECDTIPGRQCMASYFFLSQQFEDANVYLESIKAYLEEDADFNWNHGISLAANEKYEEGLEALLKVSKDSYKAELAYSLWLVKCFLMTNKPTEAWECFQQTEDSNVSYEILQLIGNECYKIGGDQYFYAARSFDELLKMDSYPDYSDGLMGACVGFFRHVLSKRHNGDGGDPGRTETEKLLEIVDLLDSSALPKGGKIAGIIRSSIQV
ncbi:hypothetical protein ACHAWF_018726 [Thalassiosira exigua]